MPIYEYQCTACGHEFEEWQKMSDKPIKKCPVCEARKVQRLVSVSSFHLKGGGWYRDGYGSSKGGGGKKGGGSSPSGSGSASSGGKSGDKGSAKSSASSAAA
jgi:putative FmdB family regulatory protein